MKLTVAGVPATVQAPLWIYEVALAGILSRPAETATIVNVTVLCEVPAGEASARNVSIDLAGPGVITPTSPSTLRRIRSGSAAQVTFRWAVPIRQLPPPYELELTATASFRSGGRQGSASAAVTTRVEPPEAPTGDAVYISDLPFDFVTNGYGNVHRDKVLTGYGPDDGQPMVLGGVQYEKGIGVNSVADIGVFLEGRYRTFRAVIGVDDGTGANASVTFRVVGDGRKLFESGVFRRSTPPQSINVDVSGVHQLDLIVDDGGDGHGDDHGDWADARLT